ncbi:hypothetical protein Thermo_01388 [Thermoplasmatales archaeon]|nr:hypothetical protein Thermo_01388 [Thermoplasmatales archaeon]
MNQCISTWLTSMEGVRMTIDSDEIEQLAASIAKASPVKSFPEGYTSELTGEKLEIPVGIDIVMFRKDEYTVISIDSERIYSTSLDEAKYIFYSAKRGQRFVLKPRDISLKDIIRRFEDDLEETVRMIEEISNGWPDSSKDELKQACSRLLGYHEIF